MIDNITKRDYLWLSLLLIAQFIFLLIVFNSGFAGASGDDFFRALATYVWRESPFLISSTFGVISFLWFPAHFWITGLIYKLSDNLVFSLTSLSILSSLVEIFLLFHLSEILFNKRTGYISILIVSFLPWQVWLGISMTEMPFYYASIVGAFLFFVKWQKENKSSHLIIASLFFLLSTMLRPEGWIFAALFSTFLVIYFLRHHQQLSNPGHVIVSMIIPCFFVLFWLAHNFQEFGSPFYFLQYSKHITQSHLNLYALSFWLKGLQYPFLMLIISPALFLLIILSLIIGYRSLKNIQRTYLFLILSQLTIMIIASMYGAGTTSTPQRYVLINVILLVPFAAHLLSHFWQKKESRMLVGFILLIFIGVNGYKSFSPPSYYKDIVEVGKYLKKSIKSGMISHLDQISSELAFRRITGKLFVTEKERLILLSSHAALEVHSGKPKNFLFDVLQLPEDQILLKTNSTTNNTGADFTSKNHFQTSAKLKEMRVKKIILQNRELMDWIPPDFHLEKIINNYAIFSHNSPTQFLPENKPADKGIKFIDKPMAKGIRLVGYKYKGGIFADGLSLLWELEKGHYDTDRYKIILRFTYIREPIRKFERVIRPIFHWYKIGKLTEKVLIKDNISLFLPNSMPNGDYSLRIILIDKFSDGVTYIRKTDDWNDKEITLLPLTLISSKREVLMNFLKNRYVEWKLLAKILLVL